MSKPEYRVEQSREDNRVFIEAHGMVVEVNITDMGIITQITKGNEVLAEFSADAED